MEPGFRLALARNGNPLLRLLCLFVANPLRPYSALAYFWMSRWLRAAVSSMMN